MGKKEVVSVVMGRLNPDDGAHQFIVLPYLTVRSGTKLGDLLKSLVRGDVKKVSTDGDVIRVIFTRTDSSFLDQSVGSGLDEFIHINLNQFIPKFAAMGTGRSTQVANVRLSEKVRTGDVFLLMPGTLNLLDMSFIAFRQEINRYINAIRGI